MRSLIVMSLTVATLSLPACNKPQWQETERTTMNAWSVQEYQRGSIEAAVISQHTLYPYHFVSNSADLNELGMRDLRVLADHYKDNPGSLSVRRDSTPSEIYKQRLETVTSMLAEHGVDTGRVRIGNRMPGGDGMSSERVLVILADKMDQPLTTPEPGFSGSRND